MRICLAILEIRNLIQGFVALATAAKEGYRFSNFTLLQMIHP